MNNTPVEERESRTAWIVNSGNQPVEVTAYSGSTPDKHSDYWWIPGEGSVLEKYLHSTKDEAREEAINNLLTQRTYINDQLTSLGVDVDAL